MNWQPQSEPRTGSPKATVEDHLAGVLPPGVPQSHREIVTARAIGKGRSRQIEADLIMFDGEPAKVTLTKWVFGWSHRYDMPSAVYWENGRWHREPVPHPDLFDGSEVGGRPRHLREGERT